MERRVKKKYLNLPTNTIILAQDESRFVSESNHITSWSTKGTSVEYPGYRYGTSLNCFGSINLQNGELISSFHDKGNALSTIEHLQKVRDKYDESIPLTFIIDNASWHKTAAVTDFCEQKNRDLSEEDEECLRRVAEDIRGNVVTWSKVQGAIDDGDWEPWHGSRGLFGPM